MAKAYLFGYGSLICPRSRGVTCPELSSRAAIPVSVNGMERIWSKRCRNGMTAMGIQSRKDSHCSGVLVPLKSRKELDLFDKRERGYRRQRIDPANVQKLDFLPEEDYEEHSEFLDSLKRQVEESNPEMLDIFVYVPEQARAPAKEHPIVQSYVDTILRGCMDVGGEPLCEQFLKTTVGWHPEEFEDHHYDETDRIASVWIDDRPDPVYSRGDPEHFRKNGSNFDKLIRKYRSDYFPLREAQSAV